LWETYCCILYTYCKLLLSHMFFIVSWGLLELGAWKNPVLVSNRLNNFKTY